MAAVMCAAAVTASATAGGRARQLSRRVGARTCDILGHARGTEAANAATLTAETVAVDVPHIAGNYVTDAGTSMIPVRRPRQADCEVALRARLRETRTSRS